MKPIKLVIKGLNSFIEEQVIDFETLTSRGFFGIFGPTGSGKSTILDGITLALYGEVARKSSNFINTNCNTMNVSFEFEISDGIKKRYLVEREFKRNKNGGCNSGKVRLSDVSNGKDSMLILEDKVSGVNKRCVSIIGLNIDDFTRTVVLPQGKFSEFLTLNGKDRRDMLERIFNLHEYGVGLSDKLISKMSDVKAKSNELNGKLSGYEGISKDVLSERKVELENIGLKLNEVNRNKVELDRIFEESKEIWSNQNDLKKKGEELEILKQNQEEIDSLKENLVLAEGALKVKPYLEGYDANLNELADVKKNIEVVSKLEVSLRDERTEKEREYKVVKEKKEKEIPVLTTKIQIVNDCIEENNKIKQLEIEINTLNKDRSSLLLVYKDYNNKIKELENNEKHIKQLLEVWEKDLESLKFDGDYKQKVNEGVVISSNYKKVKKQNELLIEKIEILSKDILLYTDNENNIKKELVKEKDCLKGEENELEKVIKTSPGELKDVIKRQEKLFSNKEKWNKFLSLEASIKNIDLSINELKANREALILKKEKLEKEISVLQEKFKEYEIINLASLLKKELKDGDICPVCGGIHSIVDGNEDISIKEISELESLLNSKKEIFNSITNDLAVINGTLLSKEDELKSQREEVIKLGEDFKCISYEEEEKLFNDFKIAVECFIKCKEDLEKNILKRKQDIIKKEGDLRSLTNGISLKNNQLKELNVEKESTLKEYDELDNRLSILVRETGINNFEDKQKEIQKSENRYNEIYNQMKNSRKELETFITDKSEYKDKLDKIISDGQEIKGLIEGKELNKKEKEEVIKSKIGEGTDLQGLKENTLLSIEIINNAFINCEKERELLENKYQQCNESLQSLTGKLNVLEKNLIENELKLSSQMKEEGFESIENVKEKMMAIEDIRLAKEKIDKYVELVARLIGTIENIKIKLNGKSISDENFNELKESKLVLENELKAYEEKYIKLNEEVNNISKKLEEQADLLKIREDLDHKMGLLNELLGLFKGKKFVEYIAISQLKYVSIEASKKLKSISGGNYGLEVDVDGKFIIRDYKNGGAERDASTLSGGETFLASLALALALSAQIQLKGTAPLELFFLDEGFGTLDENLLEVVITSLEKIHNEKLKIGLISHVEAIKNRVPVKLIITPAESGKGGSKADIEIT
ncbi:MAG: SbcC/MukB-like Walker B domain-containing protein [Clostridium sp.]